MKSMESISIDAKHGELQLSNKFNFIHRWFIFYHLNSKRTVLLDGWDLEIHGGFLSILFFKFQKEELQYCMYNTVHSVKYVSAVWGKKTFNYSNVVKLMACSGFVSSLKNTSMLYTVCTVTWIRNFFCFYDCRNFLHVNYFSFLRTEWISSLFATYKPQNVKY